MLATHAWFAEVRNAEFSDKKRTRLQEARKRVALRSTGLEVLADVLAHTSRRNQNDATPPQTPPDPCASGSPISRPRHSPLRFSTDARRPGHGQRPWPHAGPARRSGTAGFPGSAPPPSGADSSPEGDMRRRSALAEQCEWARAASRRAIQARCRSGRHRDAARPRGASRLVTEECRSCNSVSTCRRRICSEATCRLFAFRALYRHVMRDKWALPATIRSRCLILKAVIGQPPNRRAWAISRWSQSHAI